MANPIHGDLNIYGVVTIGARTDNMSAGEAYTLPYNKGANLSVLAISQAPSSTGLSGTMVQWVDLTDSPFNLVTSATMSAAIATAVEGITAGVVSLSGAGSVTVTSIGVNSFLISGGSSAAPVGITGQNGIQVTNVATNQFIISLYTALTASLAVSPNSLEVGQSITAAALTWSYNKASVVSQSLDNGIGSLSVGLRAYNYTQSQPITANKTFNLTANDGTQSAGSAATISFSKKRFWGTLPVISGGLPSNAQILAANQELSSSRNKSITYNCAVPSGGNFFWYAYPVTYGLASVTVNNFSFAAWYDPSNPGVASVSPTAISFTNAYGHTENYYMYRVFNAQNGASIPVVFQ
jgi:hypothetical protein